MNTEQQSEMEARRTLARFLDENGRIKAYPAKNSVKRLVLAYLSDKFDDGVLYMEKEVNEILSSWHTFDDYFLLRRALVDSGLLARTSSGSKYWKISG